MKKKKILLGKLVLFFVILTWKIIPNVRAMNENGTSITPPIEIIILYDNNAYDKKLRPAWGFSCLVKLPHKSILFDTGGDRSILLANLEKLEIDPQEIEVVFLSHIHGDHVGGLAGFLRKNSNVVVHLPESFPQRFKDRIKALGATVEEVDGSKELFDNVYTTGELGTGIIEQSLIIKTDKGLLIITGCAHPGVVTIIKRAMELTGDKVCLILGGFHLAGASTSKIESIIDDFFRLGVKKVSPCHCTGEKASALFEERYGADFFECGVGRRILIQ